MAALASDAIFLNDLKESAYPQEARAAAGIANV